jgi:hypothetical protein
MNFLILKKNNCTKKFKKKFLILEIKNELNVFVKFFFWGEIIQFNF